MKFLAKRRKKQDDTDKITNIKKRLDEINELHLDSINDQLDITNGALRGYIDRKSRTLSDYIANLLTFSNDDVGHELLDNLDDQIKETRSDMVGILEDIQNYDGDSDLEQSNFTFNRIGELLALVNRLDDIETILHTHIGESITDDN